MEVDSSLRAPRREDDMQKGRWGQWRANYDVSVGLISICGKSKVQQCDHLYLISGHMCQFSVLLPSYLFLLLKANFTAMTPIKSKKTKITDMNFIGVIGVCF